MSERRLRGAIHRHARFAPEGIPLEVRLIGPARARGWTLVFDLFSASQQTLVADIVRADHDAVWGALYEVNAELVMRSDAKRSVLDRIEGRRTQRDPENYELVRVTVDLNGTPRTGFAYVGREDARLRCKREHADAVVSRDYLSPMLEGARALGLPAKYIERIRETPALS